MVTLYYWSWKYLPSSAYYLAVYEEELPIQMDISMLKMMEFSLIHVHLELLFKMAVYSFFFTTDLYYWLPFVTQSTNTL